jgi:hypothetical protein
MAPCGARNAVSVGAAENASADADAAWDRLGLGALFQAELVARMGVERVLGHELMSDLLGELRLDATIFVDVSEFAFLFGGLVAEARRSRASAASQSACELTDTYSPAAIDIAPAAHPATAAVRLSARDAVAAATPMIRLAVEMTPSLAPGASDFQVSP